MGAQYVLSYSRAAGFVLGGYSIVVIRDLPKVKRGVLCSAEHTRD